MNIVKFESFVDLSNIPDSMLLDSDTVIARLTTNDSVAKYVTLEVKGDVNITYGGENYRTPSEFPEELKQLIRKRPNCWDVECSGVFIGNNNWFEMFIRDEYKRCISSDTVDAENISEDEIKEVLINYVEDKRQMKLVE